MIRENRYYVLKQSDIENYLNNEEKDYLAEIAQKIQSKRRRDNRNPNMECVIVEKDWPMYEATWKLIEDWATKS